MAATATFALKAGLWFRRGRFVMVAPRFLGNHADLARTFHSVHLSKFSEPPLPSSVDPADLARLLPVLERA
jgi:hypothetical protein